MKLLTPDWPAAPNIHACSTTRGGGVSRGPYDSLNLGAHVGDAPQAVQANRRRLGVYLNLPEQPCWLNQVHGVRITNAGEPRSRRTADGSFCDRPGGVCAVMSADCLPVLFCDRRGRRVAAAHAGWRGLCEGVLEATIDAMQIPGDELLAWLGPAIGQRAFEVDDSVRAQFIRHAPQAAEAFQAAGPGHWLADLYLLARQRLADRGLVDVYGGGLCTYHDPLRFYSYRRDRQTGRMASLIWMA